MRIWIASVVLVAALPIAAEARCLKEQTLGGFITAGKSQERSFTLFRTGARIEVNTDSLKDKLTFKVWRPDRRKAICNKGPDSLLICMPDVLTKSSEGRYRILIKNATRRDVSYQLSCSNE